MSDKLDRRSFLKVGLSGLAYFTAEATVPNCITRSARAATCNCLCNDRILVILQMAGGNDGLNTVIPRTDPVYYDSITRPNIRVPAGQEINLDGLNGLHPRLVNLANWYQQGKLAVVHNVGYVNPDLSHFTATDYYEYGSAPGAPLPTQGWAARFFDNACAGAPDVEALFYTTVGTSKLPDSLQGATGYTPPAIGSASSYVFSTNQDSVARRQAIADLNRITPLNPQIDFLQRSENTAEASVTDIATAIAQPDLVAAGSYQNDSLGNGLKLASQVIRAGFKTRIFYVTQSGYDTHAAQVAAGDPLNAGDHPELLDALDKSVHAFLTEMDISGNLDRVLLMTFSEFGRRVAENASMGTDHGAASCMFVAGGGVNAGVYGGQPNLTNLIKGNLRHTVDFRSVYARIIETWFNSSASPIFGQSTYDSIIVPNLPMINFVNANASVREWKQF